jgi:hypothetical protein
MKQIPQQIKDYLQKAPEPQKEIILIMRKVIYSIMCIQIIEYDTQALTRIGFKSNSSFDLAGMI